MADIRVAAREEQDEPGLSYAQRMMGMSQKNTEASMKGLPLIKLVIIWVEK